MTTITQEDGTPIFTAAPAPLGHGADIYDGFARADGAIGGGWTSLHTAQPVAFDPARVVSRSFGRLYGGASLNVAAYRETGLTDGYRVGMRWLAFETDLSPLNQVGPAICIDPTEPTNGLYSGATMVGDFTLNGIWGLNNMANMSAADFNTNYATASKYWDGNFIPGAQKLGAPVWLEIRVLGGQYVGLINGQRVLGPVDVPPELIGSSLHGLSGRVSDPLFPVEKLATVGIIGPWTTPLPAYPAAATFAFGTGTKAASTSSIALTYPAMAAGRQVYAALILSNPGSLTVPTGWHSVLETAVAAGARAHVLHRDTNATGSDSGTVTFTKASGTGDLGGVIFSSSGENPRGLMVGSGTATNPTTSIPIPDVSVIGLNRTALAIVSCNANVALTDPTGYTNRFSLGTAGAAVNLSISSTVLNASPNAHVPVAGAGRSGSGAGLGQSFITYPDPT